MSPGRGPKASCTGIMISVKSVAQTMDTRQACSSVPLSQKCRVLLAKGAMSTRARRAHWRTSRLRREMMGVSGCAAVGAGCGDGDRRCSLLKLPDSDSAVPKSARQMVSLCALLYTSLPSFDLRASLASEFTDGRRHSSIDG